LLNGYSEISQCIPLLAGYQKIVQKNEIFQTTVVAIFEDILEFHIEAVRYFKQKSKSAPIGKQNASTLTLFDLSAWQKLFQATWRGFNSKIKQICSSLLQQKRFIESQVKLYQFEELCEFRTETSLEFQKLRTEALSGFNNILTLRKEAQEEFQRAREAEQDSRRFKVQQWLCAIDSGMRHQNASKRRFGKTGEWLLSNPKFQGWFRLDCCSESLLWLCGMPGAGKPVKPLLKD
jgi:hypothetical protein